MCFVSALSADVTVTVVLEVVCGLPVDVFQISVYLKPFRRRSELLCVVSSVSRLERYVLSCLWCW